VARGPDGERLARIEVAFEGEPTDGPTDPLEPLESSLQQDGENAVEGPRAAVQVDEIPRVTLEADGPAVVRRRVAPEEVGHLRARDAFEPGVRRRDGVECHVRSSGRARMNPAPHRALCRRTDALIHLAGDCPGGVVSTVLSDGIVSPSGSSTRNGGVTAP